MRARLAFIGMLGLGLLFPKCLGPQLDVAHGGEVEIRRVTGFERGHLPGASPAIAGDFVLRSPAVSVLLAGSGRRISQRGHVLELTSRLETAEALPLGLSARLRVGEASHPVRLDVIDVSEHGRAPSLRLAGVVSVERSRVGVELRLSLAESRLGVTTHARLLSGPELPAAAVALSVEWRSLPPFAPGPGFLSDEAPFDTELVAGAGARAAVVLWADAGELHVVPESERHGDEAQLVRTDLHPPLRRLDASQALLWHANAGVSPGGLSDAVALVHAARGRPLRRIAFRLPNAPPGARVTLIDGAGRVEMAGVPDAEGRVSLLRLSDQPALAFASAYGHADSDAVPVAGLPSRPIELHIPEGGQIRIDAHDAFSDEPVPVRVRLTGIDGTETPDLGPSHRAEGAANAVVTISGQALIPVAPGHYRVLVSRGPEWTVHEEEIEVTETFRPHVSALLDHVVNPRKWIAADLHVHAAPSEDSDVSLPDRVATLAAEGVRFAIPTDHNHVTDYGPSVHALSLPDFGTVPGVEVSTWEPSFGHFNAYPVEVDPSRPGNGAPAFEGLSPRALFGGLRAAADDVIIQVNHPRLEPGIGYFDVMGVNPRTGTARPAYSEDFDLVEVWNGYDLARPERFDAVFSEWLGMLARGRRVVGVGNSDSHTVSYHWAGYPRSYVWVEGGDPTRTAEVLASLRAGRVMVTSGPMLQVTAGGLGPGETLYTEPGAVPVRVQVQAPPWMDVASVEAYVGTESAAREQVRRFGEPQPTVRFDRVLELAVEHESFIVIVARGEQPLDRFLGRAGVLPIAFTNPIWVRFAAPPRDGGSNAASAPTPAEDAPPPGDRPQRPKRVP